MTRRRRPSRAAADLIRFAVLFSSALASAAAFGWTPPRTTRTSGGAMVRLRAASTPMELWIDARRDTIFEGRSTIAPTRTSEADAIILGPNGSKSASAAAPRPRVAYELHEPYMNTPSLLTLDGAAVGALVDVSDPAGQDAALGLVGSVEWILIACGGGDGPNSENATRNASGDENMSAEDDGSDKEWLMIPAENLISACQGTGTKIAASVRRVGDVTGLARALELGVDALCVEATADEELWVAALEAREERRVGDANAADGNEGDDSAGADGETAAGPSLVQGTCRRVQSPAGGKGTVLADRVCVDLVRSLEPTEGCWVGSSAKLTALVLSEAAESTYVPSRPFRVNAGPVHSYIVMGDGRSTKYLSELRAGDEVLVYDVVTGTERPVAVGRLKVEVRPCVMVGLCVGRDSETEGEKGDGERRGVDGQVFLQQAETVRLGQRLGERSFVRVTELAGDGGSSEDVLLRVVSTGTHVGKAYSGKVIEQ